MTPAEFREARQALGLTQTQLARVLRYSTSKPVSQIEAGRAAASAQVAALMRAFADGYRPDDWPGDGAR